MSILNFAPEHEDKKARSWVLVFVLLAVGIGAFYLKTTLAANVSINNGLSVEFGQVVSATASCSGSSILTLTPNSTFTNTGGSTGSFYFKSLTVSGIPSSCNGQDFNISAYDSNTGSAPLALFNGSSTIAAVWDNGGSFQGGHGFIGSTVSTSNGTFTVTFNTPVALASTVSKLTLQSLNHAAGDCLTENICAIGDTGPGGGVVFYSGAAFSETGATCGANCHYLEMAPTGWGNNKPSSLSGYCGGSSGTATADPYICPLSGTLINTSTSFGSGFANTQTLSASADSTSGIYLCTHYAGTDSSAGQWFLPSGDELAALWNSSLNTKLGNFFYWSSSVSSTSGIEYGFPNSGSTFQGYSNPYSGGYANNPHAIRAIRAF